jgi:thiol:disulfide interchange protein DsbG
MALATDMQPNVIKTLVSRGIQVEKSFPATSGLLGWLLTNGGEYSIVFTTADGKTLVSGDLFNERGENLTALYAEKYIPKPDYSDAYGELEKSAYIPEGELANPKNIVYVVFDPNCPFCHLIWTALQPYQQQGLQVRWVPVAYLRESSGAKGAAMLTAKDKTGALGKIMQGFGKNDAEFAKLKVDAETQKILDHNSQLMRSFRFSGTPGLVWKDKQGKVLTKHGMPRLSELPQITGMPEQPQTDPRLARFR